MPIKLSKFQKAALLAMERDDTLLRWPGGYWTVPGTPADPAGNPTAHFGATTMRALERARLIERTLYYPEPWRDNRRLTDLGRQALDEIKRAKAQEENHQ